MGPPPELNSIRFLKRGINYSASRANENDMWDPSATPQDPDMLVHKLEGSVAQNFRPADVGHMIAPCYPDSLLTYEVLVMYLGRILGVCPSKRRFRRIQVGFGTSLCILGVCFATLCNFSISALREGLAALGKS